MIEVESLTFRYPNQINPLFDQFNWSLDRGLSCAILGSSGCGKSTFLYLLAGLLKPDKGKIRIDGQSLSRPRPNTGLILQDYGLLPWATVYENVVLGLKIRKFYGPDGKHAPRNTSGIDEQTIAHVDKWLHRLGIENLASQFPGQLSGGQRQRTAIARTLVMHPDVLLMDEPYSSLDAPTREALQQITLDLCIEQGITLVFVTHSIEEAISVGKTVLLLKAGTDQEAELFDNPLAGSKGYREKPDFQDLNKRLRGKLEVR